MVSFSIILLCVVYACILSSLRWTGGKKKHERTQIMNGMNHKWVRKRGRTKSTYETKSFATMAMATIITKPLTTMYWLERMQSNWFAWRRYRDTLLVNNSTHTHTPQTRSDYNFMHKHSALIEQLLLSMATATAKTMALATMWHQWRKLKLHQTPYAPESTESDGHMHQLDNTIERWCSLMRMHRTETSNCCRSKNY